VLTLILRHRSAIVPVRGMSTTADVGRLRDMPRVVVRDLTLTDADVARLTLESAADSHPAESPSAPESEYLVALNAGDPEYHVLIDWVAHRSVLGIVLPPGSRLLRLRNVDDLQPITLRRVDD